MNELKRIDEFQEVLANYQLSETVKQLIKRLRLVLLVAPSSSGRNTIINELVKSKKYHYIVSDTTRQPRVNNGVLEQNGREYWFRTEEQLLHDLQNGELLAPAIIHQQQVSAFGLTELKLAEQQDKIAIKEIETVGADDVYKVKPDTTFIFVIPPSFDIWMRRLKERGELPEIEIRRRLESARKEFKDALRHDYYKIIVNDNLADTIKQVDQLIRFGEHQKEHQAKGRQLIAALYKATNDFLR